MKARRISGELSETETPYCRQISEGRSRKLVPKTNLEVIWEIALVGLIIDPTSPTTTG
jgi:hypothetical protein